MLTVASLLGVPFKDVLISQLMRKFKRHYPIIMKPERVGSYIRMTVLHFKPQTDIPSKAVL